MGGSGANIPSLGQILQMRVPEDLRDRARLFEDLLPTPNRDIIGL